MHRYIEALRRRREDLDKNLEMYLSRLSALARKYGGRAYIFGSRVRGDALPSSDVDVLIVVPDGVDRLEVLHEARRLVPNTLVDIHVLNEGDAAAFMKMIKELKPL